MQQNMNIRGMRPNPTIMNPNLNYAGQMEQRPRMDLTKQDVQNSIASLISIINIAHSVNHALIFFSYGFSSAGNSPAGVWDDSSEQTVVFP